MNKNSKYKNIFITCPEFNAKYTIIDKLGDGHSSNVFKVKSKHSTELLAVKAFNHRNKFSKINKIGNIC